MPGITQIPLPGLTGGDSPPLRAKGVGRIPGTGSYSVFSSRPVMADEETREAVTSAVSTS